MILHPDQKVFTDQGLYRVLSLFEKYQAGKVTPGEDPTKILSPEGFQPISTVQKAGEVEWTWIFTGNHRDVFIHRDLEVEAQVMGHLTEWRMATAMKKGDGYPVMRNWNSKFLAVLEKYEHRKKIPFQWKFDTVRHTAQKKAQGFDVPGLKTCFVFGIPIREKQ